MILVEGGSFRMGDVFGDGDEDEQPVHQVRLDSYFIGRHEITVGEFRAFADSTDYVSTAEAGDGALVFNEEARKQIRKQDANWRNPYHQQGDRHPVVCVSWYDAIAYCNWRSEQEGLEPAYSGSGDGIVCDFTANGYRLPTDAEWEYAARSRGKERRYAWGEGDPVVDGTKYANIRDEAFKARFPFAEDIWPGGYDDGHVFTAPVGSFTPNDLGIYDLSGNVYEWCWDWFDRGYYADSPIDNPRGPASGSERCCRDIGFGCPLLYVRVLSRGLAPPDYRAEHVGFRLARSAVVPR
jgi:formylglycine-generating enzyme required for sulfatase activity